MWRAVSRTPFPCPACFTLAQSSVLVCTCIPLLVQAGTRKSEVLLLFNECNSMPPGSTQVPWPLHPTRFLKSWSTFVPANEEGLCRPAVRNRRFSWVCFPSRTSCGDRDPFFRVLFLSDHMTGAFSFASLGAPRLPRGSLRLARSSIPSKGRAPGVQRPPIPRPTLSPFLGIDHQSMDPKPSLIPEQRGGEDEVGGRDISDPRGGTPHWGHVRPWGAPSDPFQSHTWGNAHVTEWQRLT